MARTLPHRHFATPGEPLSSLEGLERLVRSGQAERFFKLANFYRFQTDDYSCGPTSAAIVLNALRYGTSLAPMSGEGIRAYTPDLIQNLTKVGLELEELYQTLRSHHLSVEKQVVTQASREFQRKRLLEALQEPRTQVIANFARYPSGHFSPVAAYDQISDSVLILDTNPSQQPWNWIDVALLMDAMQTRDNRENRGFLVISES